LPGAEGENWEFVWEPMLVRGERWTVLNLARIGGPPSEVALSEAAFPALEESLQRWDAAIADIERGNAEFFARLLASAQRMGRVQQK
jgi:hypothetical protein